MNDEPLRLGTRGSALALAQAETTAALLRQGLEREVEVVPVRVSGDEGPAPALGKGRFVAELEQALAEGRVDLAVHSLKDLPADPAEGLCLAWVSPREDAREAWVCPSGTSPEDLPQSARIGTGSLRRRALLTRLNRHWRVEPLAGNVDTRLRKVRDGQFDAIVLAAAGLKRLGRLDAATELFSLGAFPPAPTQGFLGIEARRRDTLLLDLLRRMERVEDRAAAEAERGFLRALGGDCSLPLAAWSTVEDDAIEIHGWLGDVEGRETYRGVETGWADQAREAGERLATKLLEQGGAALVERLKGVK